MKTNIGHLDSAAGAAGFIKAALAVERGEIPPTLHFTAPNPRIDFASSPFFVNTGLRPWPGDARSPRRAGVSSFGLGGTNAHAVLEQPPAPRPSAPLREWQLLALSARTPEALEAATDRLAAHLRAHPAQPLADVAFTLQVGRRAFEHRRVLVARDGGEAAAALESRAAERVSGGVAPDGGRPVAFLLHGVGSQYAGMGRGLYDAEPVYRAAVDRCAEILLPSLGLDLRGVLYPAAADGDGGAERMADTRLAQLAVFATGYALARLWMHWGVRPRAMIGHSLGEYVAATLADVWSLEDGLMLVAERARLMAGMPAGAMLALGLGEAEVQPLLRDGLCIATLNGPDSTVVSGPVPAVEAIEAEMTARGVFCRRLPIRHAAHSSMMEPVAGPLVERLRGVRLRPPSIPFVSNVTGEWIRDADATDPAYWARHLCGPVRFAQGLETLAGDGRAVLLEVGPGHALRSLVSRLPLWKGTPPPMATSLRHPLEEQPDVAHLLDAAGRLWAAGADVGWDALHAGERLRRVPLPTYPFQRRRFWLDRAPAGAGSPFAAAPPASPVDPAEWLHVPAWTRAPLPDTGVSGPPSEWLVLTDGPVGARLAGRLEALGHAVVVAEAGEAFRRTGDRRYAVRPGSAEDLRALREAMDAAGVRPLHVVHLWGMGEDEEDDEAFARAQRRGYATVMALSALAWDEDGLPPRVTVVTEGVRDVAGGEPVRPERATVLGACLSLAREHPRITCRTVDVRQGPGGVDALVRRLLAEVTADAADDVALRGPLRWVRGWQRVRVPPAAARPRPGGAWLFCGSLSQDAAALIERLASEPGTRVALVADPAFSPRDEWDARLASAADGDGAAPAIRAIRGVEAAGGEVLPLRAAAEDAAGLRAALAEASEAFGRLDGVIHVVREDARDAAPPDSAPAAELARAARELAALEEAVDGVSVDSVLLWSSLASATRHSGRPLAAAAGALAEAWVQRRAARGGEGWTSVGWDPEPSADGTDADAHPPVRAEESARAFGCLRALAGEPRVVIRRESPAARPEPRRAASPASTLADAGTELHPRPALEGEYQAPDSPAERVLAEIWRELLGIDEVGVRDSFFVLGGHSLLGLQLITRVRDAFQVELPLKTLFQAPTIAALAERIDEAILRELEEMSDEDVMALMEEAG